MGLKVGPAFDLHLPRKEDADDDPDQDESPHPRREKHGQREDPARVFQEGLLPFIVQSRIQAAGSKLRILDDETITARRDADAARVSFKIRHHRAFEL
jgi:hypothetical protein